MTMTSSPIARLRLSSNAALFMGASLLAVSSCSGGGGGGVATYTSHETKQALDPGFAAVVVGDWAGYRVLEASTGPVGTDLDGDLVPDDKVTFALSLVTGVETSANLEADEIHILDGNFYLVVDELKAGVDLGGAAAADELLLMHWDPLGLVDPAFVDSLERTAPIHAVTTAERLYYVSDAAPAANETNLRFLDLVDPTLAVTVSVGAGSLASGRILGERDDLVLLTFDETVDGDLNGDADGDTDLFVLGLLDGTDVAAEVQLTTVSLRGPGSPFDAEALDLADDGVADEGWLVGVLVDEISMNQDLNDFALFSPGWRPGQCPAAADGDMTDEVLFYIYYQHPTFAVTPMNTGLVGRNRVHVLQKPGELFVATISPEDEAGCNLNADGDVSPGADLIPRWCAAVDPALGLADILPPGSTSLMDAVSASPAGGSFGLVKLAGNLVALIDESADDDDHNGDLAEDATLVAYVDDLGTDLVWNYQLVDPEGGLVTVGAAWMGSEGAVDRLGIGLEESVVDQNLNNGCGATPKDSDKDDQVAAWLHFEAAGLVVPGVGFATQPFNSGITFAGGNAFFNVDELSDDSDYNGDGDKLDQILVRNPLGSIGCAPKAMGTMSSTLGLSLTSDNVRGGVFLADEADAKFDFNKDGDKSDLVLRWIRFF